ncbi:aryl-alcohol dehydrogenase-like predicted oxidoreductase [Geodermatophilus tzadiensis]|uniref:Aryl-alcohol dehydrogenase-like predicted oxidoreductase n=1 Tax=Geodermatophilus tzadiensis TaxID=1137988 RepID=A0A2T0TZJ2_9ACTN|nr:aldo/keto reductase [Geodermatophilus tzadiensis]PRY50978.1 aryl-alcohol dehydrogenase-like predicted oxidoreductase [Geodermatophilus tzadiensis]
MEYRTLGRSGCAVSALALGTMTFGAETDETGAHEQLDVFVEAGGTLVDTADVYSAGAAEEITGRWLAARPAEVRDRVVLATKGRMPMGEEPNAVGNSRRHLRRALDDSLRRLGVDHVDLYQLHAWDPLTPLEETLRFLDDAVRAGKIGYPGLSNFLGWQVQQAVDLAEREHLAVPVTLQPSYSLLVRQVEFEIVPACRHNGLGLLPWGPLGGGWLSGKYTREQRPTGATRLGEDPARGMEAYDRVGGRERTWDVLEAVQDVAEARGASMAQVALAWLAARPAVTSVVLGARTTEQLRGNLAAADVVLDDDETARLDAVSDPGAADYPYGEIGVEQRTRALP